MIFDSSRHWPRRQGNLNQANVVRKATDTVGELVDVCNVCALAKITKIPVPKVVETQADETQAEEGVQRRDGSIQSIVTVKVPVLH